MASLTENLPMTLFAVQPDGKLTQIEGTNFFNLKSGQSIYEKFAAFSWFTDGFKKSVEGKEIKCEGQLSKIKDAPWFEAHFVPIQAGITGYLLDITAHKAEREARAQLEKLNHSKDLFLATLSHELRTPLTAILAWAELLHSERLSKEKISLGFETILKSAQEQRKLIESMLDISKIILGKLQIDFNPIDLVSLIIKSVDSFRLTADRKHIQIETKISPASCYVQGDAYRLQQVLANLISNAIKFTPYGGIIRISLEQNEHDVFLKVKDTGKGISSVFLPHVFERFSQADHTTTRSQSGLGLGLAIVKHLVELHSGSVSAESEGADRGSIFTLKLPACAVKPEEIPAFQDLESLDQKQGRKERLKGLKILIIDDQPESVIAFGESLSQRGAHVQTAISAKEGLNKFVEFQPQAVICDIAMPDEDGYSFIGKVRNLEKESGGRVPAIALTAFVGEENENRAKEAGFNVHVGKPIDLTDFILKLEKVLVQK